MNRIITFSKIARKGFLSIGMILLTSTLAVAGSGDFQKSYPGKCIGGSQCGGKRNHLVIPLKQSVFVNRIEFYADDNIGSSANAEVSVFVDNEPVAEDIDIKREGKLHVVKVDQYAQEIRIKPANDDETNIHEVRVYGTIERHSPNRPYPKSKPQIRPNPSEETFQERVPGKCIGGKRCGNYMVIPFRHPVFVEEIEIYADGNPGRSKHSVISVFADDRPVAQHINIDPRRGSYSVPINQRVRQIRIQPAGNKEINIQEVVVYRSRGEESYPERGPSIERRPTERRPLPGRGSSQGGSSGSSF